MRKAILILTSLLITSLGVTQAQNVFKKYGFKKEVLTLSKGKYQEIFKNDEVVQIGTVLVNTKTNKVIKLLNEDTTKTTYNSELSSRFLTIDPLAEKYPWQSPYVFCNNNPIIYVDPDGQEGIVVSGQPGDHENREHFLVNGLDRAKQLQKQYNKEGNGEKATWIVYNGGENKGGYSSETIEKYQKMADKAGVSMQVVDNADNIVDYVNEKTGGASRNNDLITNFVYIGHATPGDLDVGFVNHNIFNMATNVTLDVSDFKKNAFAPNSNANLVGGCRTAVDGNLLFERSAAEQMADKVGGVVKASNVRVYYPGGVVSDEQLVKHNNGRIITIKGRNKK